MGDLTEHFSRWEFKCKCCGADDINLDLVNKLETAREKAETRFTITSGFRCKKYNDVLVEQGKAAEWSEHPEGGASDIFILNGETRFKILDGLFHAGFKRIIQGIDYIHVDISTEKPQEICLLSQQILKHIK